MNCDVVVRSLGLIFLYGAPAFGCTNASAAECAREQVKRVKQLGARHHVLVMQLSRQFKRSHSTKTENSGQ
jgi:hypothetical protein